MTLRHLFAGYVAIGVTAAAWLFARERAAGRARPALGPALGSALLCVPLWPLWLPVAFSHEADERGPLAARVGSAKVTLRETARVCAEAGLARLFTEAAAAALAAGLARALERILRMDRLLATPSFDVRRAAERLARLEAEGAGRAAELARTQVEHAGLLRAAREREARALEELVELVSSLRAQVLLVGVAGGALGAWPGEAEDLSAEIRSRLEALSAALGPELEVGGGARG